MRKSAATMSKLSPDLEKQVIERHLKGGETLDAIRKWLDSEHGVTITHQALSLRVKKHRPARRDATPIDDSDLDALDDFDAHRARLSRLLKEVTADAFADRSQTAIANVAKVTAAWARLEEAHRAAHAPVDESISDLDSLLALP